MAPVRLQVLGVPFGGHLSGKDADGEYFSSKTETGLEDIGRIGLFWHHARDGVMRRIGYAENWRKAADGWWCSAVVDDVQLGDTIKRMAEAGSLFASSGAIGHLVQRGKDGHLTRWLVGELSLTGNPSNRLAVAQLAPTVAPELVAMTDRMVESTFRMQRMRPYNDPSLDRLQDAVFTLRENFAA